MTLPAVTVRAWSSWTSGEPDVSQIPAMLRRRMSRLTRTAIAVAMDCCRQGGVSPSAVRVVYASRHGEMPVTMQLLRTITAHEMLSPTDFSGSVHHTALGYLSIVAQNQQPKRCLSAGESSFAQAFLEAVTWLEEDASSPVLLLFADDEVPLPFGRYVPHNCAHAVAFLLQRENAPDRAQVSLQMTTGTAATSSSEEAPALGFLHWWTGSETSLERVWKGTRWRWEKVSQ